MTSKTSQDYFLNVLIFGEQTRSDEELLDALPHLGDDDIIGYVSYANSDICNGGFFQYYSNAIFDAKKHIEFLKQLEMFEMADLVQQSLNIFPESIQQVRKDVDIEPIDEIVLELIGDKDCFEKIERRYFEICFAMTPYLANWVRKHYWQFFEK